jgi:hypothetical protein
LGFVVQITDRSGRVLSYSKFGGGSASIGRAYDCDVILDDSYADARHLKVSETVKGLILDEVSQEAFTLVKGKSVRATSVAIESGDALVVGRSHLRIVSSTQPVLPVLPLSRVDRVIAEVSRPLPAAMSTLLFVASFGTTQYLETVTAFNFNDWLLFTLGPLMFPVFWVCVCALVTRVVRQDSRFIQHWMVVIGYLFFDMAYSYIDQILRFNFGINLMVRSSGLLILGTALMLMFWCQLRIAFTQTNLSRTLIATTLSAAVVGFGYVNFQRFNDFDTLRPQFEPTLLPVVFSLRTPIETERFLHQAETLFQFEVKDIASQ